MTMTKYGVEPTSLTKEAEDADAVKGDKVDKKVEKKKPATGHNDDV